jgi:hypothetical protein
MAIYQPILAFDPQTPLDLLDNTFIFDTLPVGDVIVTATATADDTALVIGPVISVSPNVIVWITGGTIGGTATITCKINTAEGREYNRSAEMAIQAIVS